MTRLRAVAWATITVPVVLLLTIHTQQVSATVNLIFDEGFEDRQQEFQADHVGYRGYHNTEIQMVRLARNLTVDERAIQNGIEHTRNQHDKVLSEFYALSLVRLLHMHYSPDYPGQLRDGIVADMKDVLFNFKYWFDDRPEIQLNSMTENHQIYFYATEYLVGQLFPTTVFVGSGKTGAEHMTGGKERVLRWCNDKERFGYLEWLAPHFYGVNMSPLITLVDFAQDAEVRNHATIAMDMLVYDIALNSYKGYLGATAGRTPRLHEKLHLDATSVAQLTWLLFGNVGGRSAAVRRETVVLATSIGYEVPKVLVDIAHSDLTFVNKQRNGILVEDGPDYGYGYETIEDAMFWAAMGAWYHPKVLPLMGKMARQYNYENGSAETDFTEAMHKIGLMPRFAVRSLARMTWPITIALEYQRANIITYRSASAGTLSSAQDHRLQGHLGFQQSAFQATLGNRAVVFTSHPGLLQHHAAYNDWLGGSSMPRVGQYQNVAIVIYNAKPAAKMAWSLAAGFGFVFEQKVEDTMDQLGADGLDFSTPQYTHAYFPRREFDEVRNAGHWTLARKGSAYIALFSVEEPYWITDGTYANRELRANGTQNVWICELGSQEEHGSFEEFVSGITAHSVRVSGENGIEGVTYESPSQGTMQFGWDEPLIVGDKEVDLGPYPRYENPFSNMEWGATTATIEYEGSSLFWDFENGIRDGA